MNRSALQVAAACAVVILPMTAAHAFAGVPRYEEALPLRHRLIIEHGKLQRLPDSHSEPAPVVHAPKRITPIYAPTRIEPARLPRPRPATVNEPGEIDLPLTLPPATDTSTETEGAPSWQSYAKIAGAALLGFSLMGLLVAWYRKRKAARTL